MNIFDFLQKNVSTTKKTECVDRLIDLGITFAEMNFFHNQLIYYFSKQLEFLESYKWAGDTFTIKNGVETKTPASKNRKIIFEGWIKKGFPALICFTNSYIKSFTTFRNKVYLLVNKGEDLEIKEKNKRRNAIKDVNAKKMLNFFDKYKNLITQRNTIHHDFNKFAVSLVKEFLQSKEMSSPLITEMKKFEEKVTEIKNIHSKIFREFFPLLNAYFD
jgi:hypothetical protein